MRFLVFWCVLFGFLGILNAATVKNGVAEEKEEDEEVYGDLGGSDLQKDGPNGADYYDEDTGDGGDPTEIEQVNTSVNVKLLSHGEVFIRNVGDVVTLPCRISPKDVIRMWMKDTTLIFQDRISLNADKKHNLTVEGDLQVTVESPEDYGEYKCYVADSDSKLEIVHKVVAPTSPNITNLYVKENKRVFNLGDSFTLTCEAIGYPKPVISWHKDNQILGTNGQSLTISNAKAKHAGAYRCLADNKVGNPAHAHIEIQINHPPIVSVDEYLVNSDHGEDAQLICEVKAYPAPSVVWQRNNVNVMPDGDRIQFKSERNNERNLLFIKGVTEKDFGAYKCVASNSLGSQQKQVKLVKTPALRQLEAKHHQEDPSGKVLQWKVESKQPISKHELQYRRKGESDWTTINPEVQSSDSEQYLIKHTLKNLEPGVYETRARSRNTHGWSDYSNIVPFEQATPAEHRTEDITPVGESTSSSSAIYSSLPLIVLVTIIVHMRQ